MTRAYLLEQLHQPGMVPLLIVLAVMLTLMAGWRVRQWARTQPADDALANLAMVLGFAWSSDVIWELTGQLGWQWAFRIPLFAILELLLTIAMIRTKRNLRELGYAGSAGQTAWLITVGMSMAAALVSHSLLEAFVRLLIPVLVTKTWWDGVVKGRRRAAGATSWRWTPRRLLLAIGAIEPGERDVETVNRERVTQQMTRLEYRRRHGVAFLARRRAARLARLSLTADDDMISAVQQRVGRATWFEVTQPAEPEAASPAGVPASVAASALAARVRHRRSLRTLRVTHPRPVVVAAQPVREDDRATHEIDTLVRVIKEANPASPNRLIARLACVSEPTVRRALRRIRQAEPAQINGRVPELDGAR